MKKEREQWWKSQRGSVCEGEDRERGGGSEFSHVFSLKCVDSVRSGNILDDIIVIGEINIPSLGSKFLNESSQEWAQKGGQK